MSLKTLTALLSLILFATLLPANASQRSTRFPFHGNQPLPAKQTNIKLLNGTQLQMEEGGLLAGKGKPGADFAFADWDGEQGSVAFWLQPQDWDAKTKENVMLISPREAKGGTFLIYKYLDTDKLWFYGEHPSAEGQRRRVNINFSYNELKDWKKGEWYHLAFVWKRGAFARLYVNGTLTNTVEGSFVFPESMTGLTLGAASKVQTLFRDLYLSTSLLSEGEIALLARNKPSDASEKAAPSSSSAMQTRNLFAFPDHGNRPPVIDGILKEDEYTGVYSGLISTDTHTAYREAHAIRTASDEEFLYIGASIALPDGYTPSSISTTRDAQEQISKGDLFTLFIRPDDNLDLKTFEGYYLTIAPNGNVYDAWEEVGWTRMFAHRKESFNAHLEHKSRIEKGIWTIEIKIARQDLRISKSERFSFGLGFQIAGNRVALTDHPVWFDHYQAFSVGLITPIQVQTSLGKLNEGAIAFEGVLQGATSGNGQGKVTVGLPLIQEVAESMVVEHKIGEEIRVELREIVNQWEAPFKLEAAKPTKVTHHVRLETPDTYTLIASLEADGKMLYQQQIPFVYASPVEVELKTIPSRDEIRAHCSFYGVERSLLGRAELVFHEKKSGKAVQSEAFTIERPSEVRTFSMAKLKPGFYNVEATLFNKANEPIGRRAIPFEKRVTPAWLTQRKGIEALSPEWVPKEWQPLEVKEGEPLVIKAWGRELEFSAGSLLSGITSQGEAQLKSGLILRYTSEGKEHRVELQTPRVESSHVGRVTLTQQGESPHFKCTILHTIEFDGLHKISLRLEPTQEEPVINQLALEMPFNRAALSVVKWGTSWESGTPSDREFTSLPHLWLGNDRAGCVIFAENSKGWQIHSKKPRVSLRNDQETSTVSYHFINHVAAVREPMEITLALQATPVKPSFANWRDIRPHGWGWTPPPTNLFIVDPRTWTSSYSLPIPRSWKVVEDLVTHARENRQRVYPYLTPFTISLYDMVHRDLPYLKPDQPVPPEKLYTQAKGTPKIDDYWYHAEDWNLSPLQFNSDGSGKETTQMACLSPSGTWSDYFAGKVEEILKQSDVDGFYFDLPMPLQNFDASKGLAYTTRDGVQEGTQEHFATRDLYKRLYYLFDQYRGPARKPYILGHGFPSDQPIATFWDVNFHGEALKPFTPFEFTRWNLQEKTSGAPLAKPAVDSDKRSYDGLSYRAAHGPQFNLPIMYLPQYGYRKELYHNTHSRETLSWTFLHNNLLWPAYLPPQPVYRFWEKVEMAYGMGGTEFHPFWNNGISTSPESVRASYWTKADAGAGVLLAIANWSDQGQEATVTLPEKLASFSSATDLETGEKLSVTQTLKAKIPAHDLRVFRLLPNPPGQ